jgi:2-polyprenyl-3-methyl-5-hydroxy-6-metoxy-1,4-benzoquinol methylase
VIEVASNDGYLLQYFKEQGIPVLGIEPAKNVAEIAEGIGIPTVTEFFGSETASQLSRDGKQADLLLGNNVLAHVPDLNDFVRGLKIVLKPNGIITMEFPHLLNLIKENQFDTIYHEHFSYLSLLTVKKVFAAKDLTIFDVEELPTHGGSLRIYACHSDNKLIKRLPAVKNLEYREVSSGLNRIETYDRFSEEVKKTKRDILNFFIDAKNQKKKIVGYGAPAKGNTLLNYCGIRTDFIEYTVDRSPHKQGHHLPGTHIPIFHPDRIKETKPDYLVILPWNLKKEVIQQMANIKDWGCKFVTLIPNVRVYL